MNLFYELVPLAIYCLLTFWYFQCLAHRDRCVNHCPVGFPDDTFLCDMLPVWLSCRSELPPALECLELPPATLAATFAMTGIAGASGGVVDVSPLRASS